MTREALNRCATSDSAPLFDPSCHAKWWTKGSVLWTPMHDLMRNETSNND